MMLQVENIMKSYGSSLAPILNDFCLALAPGDFCVVIGSNGSGKSTLLKALSGESEIDSGQIYINNNRVTSQSFSERAKVISSVSQNTELGTIGEMTLMENLLLSQLRGKKAKFKLLKRKDATLREKVLDLNPGLAPFLNKPLKSLSGGQRQMIATIMATLNNPLLLLLDEHCSALDPKTQKTVMDFTASVIEKNGTTALMVTHDLTDALYYGNRLIMLHDGKIALDIKGQEKKSLSVSNLLALFQSCEGALS
jgi:putative ABC transport system ATP-binding protein